MGNYKLKEKNAALKEENDKCNDDLDFKTKQISILKSRVTDYQKKVQKYKQTSEAVNNSNHHQLAQKSKDLDELQVQLLQNEKRVSDIFQEKLALQEQFDELKEKMKAYESEI